MEREFKIEPAPPGMEDAIIESAQGREVFRVTSDGKIVVAEWANLDEAAKAFWEVVEQFNPFRRRIAEAYEDAARISENVECAEWAADAIRARAKEIGT